jgi:N4-gp56 family major capsid protein
MGFEPVGVFNFFKDKGMGKTTTAQVTPALNGFLSRTLLERAQPLLVHDKFGQVQDLPKNNGNVIKFRKYGALTKATTPLVEGVTPAGQSLSITDVTATVQQYGDFVTLTDFLIITTFEALLTEVAELLGEQAGQSLDTVVRDILNAGTSVQYADASNPKVNAARTDVTSADKIAADELRIAIRTQSRNNAPKMTTMVNPETGYGTTPVAAGYIAIVHPDTTYDLKGVSGFEAVEKYAHVAKSLLPGEVGKFEQLRFVESTEAKVFTGGGASGIDVYSTLILGKNAYGISRISGEAMENIVKPLGSGGTADALNQRSTSGWKATLTAKILQQLFMLRIEHAVSA